MLTNMLNSNRVLNLCDNNSYNDNWVIDELTKLSKIIVLI